ncbi:MAG TPA: hypothetical protein VEF04_03005, partial [Blastocatellia bacterium]|nr:hypothetical protein [Blastocatellia bacterium]
FAGNDLKPFQSERIVFKIDEKIVQMQRAKKSEFLQSSVNQNFKDSEILEKHRGWEESYLSDLLKAKLNVTSEKVTARTNREALLWHFPMPEGMNKQVDHQVFLTTVIGEQVLILNYSVEKGDTVANATKYLIESMNTLKVSDKPIDVKALQEEIRKG